MSNKTEAIERLRIAEKIVSRHSTVFTPQEAIQLAMAMRFLLAYIEGGEEESADG